MGLAVTIAVVDDELINISKIQRDTIVEGLVLVYCYKYQVQVVGCSLPPTSMDWVASGKPEIVRHVE